MSATVVSKTDQSITIQLTFSLAGSMLAVEESIRDTLNEAGLLATEEKLSSFDTDGTPLNPVMSR